MIAISRDDNFFFLHQPDAGLVVPVLLDFEKAIIEVRVPSVYELRSNFVVYGSFDEALSVLDQTRRTLAIYARRFAQECCKVLYDQGSLLNKTIFQLRTLVESRRDRIETNLGMGSPTKGRDDLAQQHHFDIAADVYSAAGAEVWSRHGRVSDRVRVSGSQRTATAFSSGGSSSARSSDYYSLSIGSGDKPQLYNVDLSTNFGNERSITWSVDPAKQRGKDAVVLESLWATYTGALPVNQTFRAAIVATSADAHLDALGAKPENPRASKAPRSTTVTADVKLPYSGLLKNTTGGER